MKLRTQTHKRMRWDEKKMREREKKRTRTLAHTIVKTLGQVFFPVWFFSCTQTRALFFAIFPFLPFNSMVFLLRSFIFFAVALNRRCSTCTERIFNILFFIFFVFVHFILFTSIQVWADSFSIYTFFFDLLSESQSIFSVAPVKVCVTHTLKVTPNFPEKSVWVCVCSKYI